MRKQKTVLGNYSRVSPPDLTMTCPRYGMFCFLWHTVQGFEICHVIKLAGSWQRQKINEIGRLVEELGEKKWKTSRQLMKVEAMGPERTEGGEREGGWSTGPVSSHIKNYFCKHASVQELCFWHICTAILLPFRQLTGTRKGRNEKKIEWAIS